jgi:hypothetical protein
MAWQLIDAMTGEFDAAAHRDEYREALLGIIEAKANGAEIAAPAAAPAAQVSDLMAALEASVAAAKAARVPRRPQTIAEAKAAAGPGPEVRARTGRRIRLRPNKRPRSWRRLAAASRPSNPGRRRYRR